MNNHDAPCSTCGHATHELADPLTPLEAEWLSWVRRDLADLIREIEGDDPPTVTFPLVEQ